MRFEQVPEFEKDLKRLTKKWRSLPSDLEDVSLQITDLYTDHERSVEVRKAFFNGKRAIILQKLENGEVVKMRLDVASLGNNSVRIIFIALKQSDRVLFLELFAKNEKPRKDTKRIERYLPR